MENGGVVNVIGGDGGPTDGLSIPQDVRLYLEAVFALCPHPEEYVKYRLHLATRLSVAAIQSWFEQRRMVARDVGVVVPHTPLPGLSMQPLKIPPVPDSSGAVAAKVVDAADAQQARGEAPGPPIAQPEELHAAASASGEAGGCESTEATHSTGVGEGLRFNQGPGGTSGGEPHPGNAPPWPAGHALHGEDGGTIGQNAADPGSEHTAVALGRAASQAVTAAQLRGRLVNRLNAPAEPDRPPGAAAPPVDGPAGPELPVEAIVPSWSRLGTSPPGLAAPLGAAWGGAEGQGLPRDGLGSGVWLGSGADHRGGPSVAAGDVEGHMGSDEGLTGEDGEGLESGEGSSVGGLGRFTEADLACVAHLVGLQTITSTQEHAGSRSLFLFEQLTRLDSLDGGDAAPAAKRRRTRHQHFWRNSDKFPPQHRLYVAAADVAPALAGAPVAPQPALAPAQRTNQWTVVLTAAGVVAFLNKRVSPLGVRLFRALQAALACATAVGGRLPEAPSLLRAGPPRPTLEAPPNAPGAAPRPPEVAVPLGLPGG